MDSARQLLKSLLGLAHLLNRTLILPASLCDCQDVEKVEQCNGAPVLPFGCPLRPPLADALRLERWQKLSPTLVRPANFLLGAAGPLPKPLRRSHVRVLMPDGMSDSETLYALRSYVDTRILEVERAGAAYCGWDPRHDRTGSGRRFDAFADPLLEPWPSFRAATAAPVSLVACQHFHGGAGEVQRFTNIGEAEDTHEVLSPFEQLPPSIRRLPNGSDIVITFATGSVATMALNWARAAQQAGVADVLIGALDEAMMAVCRAEGVPCVLIQGGAISAELTSKGAAQNLRSRPSLYPKMSVLKVGFYRELLKFGYNVWACDADAVLVGDPRPLMREPEWRDAQVAAATDCIDIPLDNRRPLLHCDLNTGLVFMRSEPAVIDFVLRWRETIASAKELRIRDQAAFNMLLKARPLRQAKFRLFTAANGPKNDLLLGVLPLARFLNGHTRFVQHAHTLPGAAPPLAVHMTYQFAEGAKFAYGKRQRLREARLWLVDDDAYYSGRYVKVADRSANLPLKPLGPTVHSKEAIEYHLAEARHRAKVLRSLLGVAKALGRHVILPRMLCYCDFMWKEMKACRVGGAETMRLPFDCPMDHVLDTPRWFENELGVEVREPSFFTNPRVPPNVTGSIAKVELPKGAAMDDAQIVELLKPHEGAAVIEVGDVAGSFCGFRDAKLNDIYRRESERLLSYQRTPFCMMEGSDNAPLFSQCCFPRKPGDKFFPCIHGFDPPEALPKCGGI